MLKVITKVTGFYPDFKHTDEPVDRLEETRVYINSLEKRIVELEDLVKLLRPPVTYPATPDRPARPVETLYVPEFPLPKSELHNRGCAVSWSLGEPAVCTCPERKP